MGEASRLASPNSRSLGRPEKSPDGGASASASFGRSLRLPLTAQIYQASEAARTMAKHLGRRYR